MSISITGFPNNYCIEKTPVLRAEMESRDLAKHTIFFEYNLLNVLFSVLPVNPLP